MLRNMIPGTSVYAHSGRLGIEPHGYVRTVRLQATRNAGWRAAESSEERRMMMGADLLEMRCTTQRALRLTAIKKQRRSCSTNDEERTSDDDRSGVQGQLDQEQQSELTNLAVQLAELTNSVLQSMSGGETIDVLYDEFLEGVKTKIIEDLTKEHAALLYFSNNPSSMMPAWLSESPPGIILHSNEVDARLESRAEQMKLDLRSFVEEQGFVCSLVYFDGGASAFVRCLYVDLRLDMANIPKKKAQENVDDGS